MSTPVHPVYAKVLAAQRENGPALESIPVEDYRAWADSQMKQAAKDLPNVCIQETMFKHNDRNVPLTILRLPVEEVAADEILPVVMYL